LKGHFEAGEREGKIGRGNREGKGKGTEGTGETPRNKLLVTALATTVAKIFTLSE